MAEAVLMLVDKETSDKENGRPRFSCPVCSASTYSSQKGLARHFKEKHQPSSKDEPLVLACQLCGKRLGLSVF